MSINKELYIAGSIGPPSDERVGMFLRDNNLLARKYQEDSEITQLQQGRILKLESVGMDTKLSVDGIDSSVFTGTGENGLEKVLSEYLLRYHSYSLSDLTSRQDYDSLAKYTKDGGINLEFTPDEWIKGNEFINKLPEEYNRLIAFTINERGMFPKIWTLEAQKNYWNASLNGGLPITKKADPIHEGTFLLHDIIHFVFRDPIITGLETETEKQAYVAFRMMSEAFTLTLADMVAVDKSQIEMNGYNTQKRKAHPLLKSLNLKYNQSLALRRLLHANSVFALFGDDSEFIEMGADEETLEAYKSKYSPFFSTDFRWNYSNVETVSRNTKESLGKNQFKDIFSLVSSPFNTQDLVNQISEEDTTTLNFEKLFSLFWNQLNEALIYSQPVDKLKYIKLAGIKYLRGQAILGIDMTELSESSKFISTINDAIKLLGVASNVDDALSKFNSANEQIHIKIEEMAFAEELLPHQGVVNKLHVPQFPPQFLSYDKPLEKYKPVDVVSQDVFRGRLKRFDYKV